MDLNTIKQQMPRPDGAAMKHVLTGLLMFVLGVFVYVAYSGYRSHQSSFGDVSAGSSSESAARAGRTSGVESSAAPSGAQVPVPEAGDAEQGAGSTARPAAPSTDTISPNPPNGMTFGGGGHFQLYRQGDLTWRLNTESGETCILFATNEEWRQPRVRRSACPKPRRE